MRYTLQIDAIPGLSLSSSSIKLMREVMVNDVVKPLEEGTLFTVKIYDTKIDQIIYIIRGKRRNFGMGSLYERLSVTRLKPPQGHAFRTSEERKRERNCNDTQSSEL